ncbi:outer membrane protein transport protein [Vibrio sp. Of7-15]|uniref:outer membrane protein transport protein n=1 Tax=Vibrio sp. Of7-15 TaxID=2724879 RepID=UPI001EF233ED|nr:outer membrane protein transport protein [Vibrio sp. Of7-15]MCG7495893.1 outer membrane protein transport protein [Vibrio sp. Of7-15]
MLNKNKAIPLTALAALISFNVHSAGFQVAEHSASGLGRAFSGEAAVADNASVLARNPAAMTLFDTAQFSGALSIIDPVVDVKDTTNNQSSNDVAPMQIVPAAYYISPINDKFSWGLGLFTTYGVATDYPDDIAAGDMAGDTSLVSVNLNPNVAYRFNEQWSFGAGFNIVYAHAELNRHVGVLPITGSNPSDKLISMEGDTFAYGWNVGVLYELDQDNRFGFGYRSSVEIDFDDGKFTDHKTTITGTPGTSTTGKLAVTLPDIMEFSGFHQINEQWATHYSLQWTQWSDFKELRATGSGCNSTSGAGICFLKEEKYEDNKRWSIGATYAYSAALTLRAGLAYDEQAGEATLSIPDSDRFWYATGATYAFSDNTSIDAGFSLVQSKDGSFEEKNSLGNTFTFDSEGVAYIAAIQINHSFN